MEFTDQQNKVITTRDQDILVPASAGSGKTTVLVERVLELLQDDFNLGIEDFLLMTFTKDAAKNMEVKIRQALLNSSNQHLQQQADRVAMADISTIHAFCQEIIRRYYYVIDLDPQYRLLSDDTEKVLLLNQAWDDVREAEYLADEGQKDPQSRLFDRLVANFAGDRSDDRLYEVVKDLYDEALAKPKPNRWLASLKAAYQLKGDDADQWGFFQQQLKGRMKQSLAAPLEKLTAAAEEAANDHLGVFADQLAGDVDQLRAIIAAVNAGRWETIRAKIGDSFKTVRHKGLKKGSDQYAHYEELKVVRDEVKAAVKGWSDYFTLSQKQVVHLSAVAAELVGKLAEVVERFSSRYQELKRDRHLLDFADLEHFAYQILTIDSEEGHRAQEELRHRYREMMVDEYQDTNALQDAILNRLKTPGYNHLFMVGDVKQSIYRFRQADPTIFRQRSEDFAKDDSQGTSIPLADNFRSMPNVLHFINGLFEQLMDKDFGDVDYDQNAQLNFGASWYQKATDHPAELLLYSANHVVDGQPAGTMEADKLTGEVRMIAMRIKQLVKDEQIFDPQTGQERPIEFRDIAILSRTKGINNAVVEQFGLEDIPVTVSDVNNFFASTEVRLMLDLLSLLDNPYQDIPLVAVLRSPIVGMTEPEMAYLRLINRNIPYYQVLSSFNYNKGRGIVLTPKAAGIDLKALEDKVAAFLQHLHHWRQLAQRQSLVTLLWTIYRQTGYLDYVGGMPGGEQRQANLHALYQRADSYETRGYQGVYQFVRFIRQLQKQDKDIGQAARQAAGNSVSVMTIHGSKGLEFPVVFLADTAHQFKNDTAPATIDADAGIGISVVEKQPSAKTGQTTTDDDDQERNEPANQDAATAGDGLLSGIPVRYMLPQRQLISDAKRTAERAEDLRILYVALTRAEQRLIITGSVNDRQQRTISQLVAAVRKANQAGQQVLPASLRVSAQSYLSWILMALARDPQLADTLFDRQLDLEDRHQRKSPLPVTINEYDQQAVESQLAAQLPQETEQPAQQAGPELTAEDRQWIHDVLNFDYPHAAATTATAFESVSKIRGMVSTDPDDLEMGQISFNRGRSQQSWEAVDVFATPRFTQQEKKQPARTVVGTATHLVFQKLPLDQPVTVKRVENQIARLVDQQLIPGPEVAAAIDVEGIVAFYQTPVGQALLADPQAVHREQPFSMVIPAGDLDAKLSRQDGDILIHGIIDGLQYGDDGITLFDYKTDLRRRGESQDEFEQRMLQHYAGQLTLYADALNKMSAGAAERTANGQPLRVIHQYLYLVTTRTLLPAPLLK